MPTVNIFAKSSHVIEKTKGPTECYCENVINNTTHYLGGSSVAGACFCFLVCSYLSLVCVDLWGGVEGPVSLVSSKEDDWNRNKCKAFPSLQLRNPQQ